MADVFEQRNDQDGYDAFWGKTVVRLGLSPLSDEAQKLYRNSPALIFTAHANREVEREQFERLGELLGTTWTRERVQAMMAPASSQRREPRSRLVIPLLLGMQPKLQEFIQKSFGAALGITPPDWYQQNQGEVVEGYEMDRDAFIQVASLFTPLISK